MTPDAAKASGPLALLSEIASRLAEGGEIVATVGGVITRLHRALNATEVSLWLYASGTLRRSAIAGAPLLTVDDVQGAIEGILREHPWTVEQDWAPATSTFRAISGT